MADIRLPTSWQPCPSSPPGTWPHRAPGVSSGALLQLSACRTTAGQGIGEGGYGLAVDAAGNAYVTGVTHSVDFPTVSPLQALRGSGDAFVTKLNPAGTALRQRPDS